MHVCIAAWKPFQKPPPQSCWSWSVVELWKWLQSGHGSVFFFYGTQDGAQHEDERAPLAVLFS